MFLNVLLGLMIIGLTVVIQAYGTNLWLKKFIAAQRKFSEVQFNKRTVRILTLTSSFLIFLHLIQASIWALVYLFMPSIGQFQSFEKAIYFSLVTFTTLGYGEITIESGSRLLSGLEAINGIMMIGWSTAFMFFVYQEIVRTEVGHRNIGKK
jgi:voltage-gated potassium channel Kch